MVPTYLLLKIHDTCFFKYYLYYILNEVFQTKKIISDGRSDRPNPKRSLETPQLFDNPPKTTHTH